MSLDYLQLRNQVRSLGEQAIKQEETLKSLQEEASVVLKEYAEKQEKLREKVFRAVDQTRNLRCAIPGRESLNASFAVQEMKADLGIVAADGSQINPDPHGAVMYYLINTGAIRLWCGKGEAPGVFMESRLYYGDDLHTNHGTVSAGMVALKRDLRERAFLSELVQAWIAEERHPQVMLGLTDGPLELWEPRETSGDTAKEYREALEKYRKSLRELKHCGAATAGYVDHPRADLVVRLLEIAVLPENELSNADTVRRYRGVTDTALFREILHTGERSAVFGIQAQSAKDYPDELGLHFFYLNAGTSGRSVLARVEIPAWVAKDDFLLNIVHSALLEQSRILGTRSYPYLLHRAHEAAVVTYDDRDQLTQMILLELRRRGIFVGEGSVKQAVKNQMKK